MRCKLCGKDYPENKLSDEHYPAHSVGNNDIVQLDLVAMMDMFMSERTASELKVRVNNGESLNDITDDIPQLLELVDNGKMGMRPAVELSYLDKDDQAMVYELMLDLFVLPHMHKP